MQASPIIESKNFQQYEAVFLQLADEHRTISAFELQELLEACLPNGDDTCQKNIHEEQFREQFDEAHV